MVIGIVLIGGIGSRLDKSTPKQFLKVNDIPLYLYSVNVFEKNPLVDKILIVSVKEYISKIKRSLKGYLKAIEVISGGESRQLSSFEALKYLKSQNISDNDLVLLHDGARPNVDDSLINNLIESLKDNVGVRPILPYEDVIYDDGSLSVILNDKKYVVQTPQAFRFIDIYDAHKKLNDLGITDLKDDISCLMYFNKQFKDILGSKLNFKITNSDNLEQFKKFDYHK